jgi:hypothetical protein
MDHPIVHGADDIESWGCRRLRWLRHGCVYFAESGIERMFRLAPKAPMRTDASFPSTQAPSTSSRMQASASSVLWDWRYRPNASAQELVDAPSPAVAHQGLSPGQERLGQLHLDRLGHLLSHTGVSL